jgi:hypothetical protein
MLATETFRRHPFYIIMLFPLMFFLSLPPFVQFLILFLYQYFLFHAVSIINMFETYLHFVVHLTTMSVAEILEFQVTG